MFGVFPELKVEQGDVSGVWNKFEDEFIIAAELKHLELGKEVFTVVSFLGSRRTGR